MSRQALDDYNTAAQLISEQADLARFGGGRDEKLVERAEAALGVRFPPSYRSFAREFGAGHIAGEEFYGVTDDNFEEGPIPNGIWLTLTERQDSGLPEALVVVGPLDSGDRGMAASFAMQEGPPAPCIAWSVAP